MGGTSHEKWMFLQQKFEKHLILRAIIKKDPYSNED